jgi:feruloyl-CoA synthase
LVQTHHNASTAATILLPADADAAAIIAQPGVRDALRDRIRRHNVIAQGGSTRIAGALLLAEPPSIDANEITDKGYINHRAVLSRREALLELLYRGPTLPKILIVSAATA